MDSDVDTLAILTDSQVYPYGTYEQYNPNAANNEGHFYMECSNQGLCDREEGTCACFDGFEGSACQRASCPNSCSNHGSCESISEFATTAGGTLFSKGLATGDTTYDFWDAKVSYGCRCDPWFTGADCSQRLCKVGVDPMYYETEQVTYETIAIDGLNTANGGQSFRLRFWDYWGESYITDSIAQNANAATIKKALEALPNGVISDVECDTPESDTDSAFFSSRGAHMMCQFKTNPGALRLPEVYSQSAANIDISGTPLRGEDENLCTTLHSVKVSAISNAATLEVTLASSVLLPTITADSGNGLLIKINDHYGVVTAQNSGTGVLTTASALSHTGLNSLSLDLYYSTAEMTAVGALTTAAVGGTTLTFGSVDNGVAVGDKIICESQIFTVVSISSNDITVDRPFYGTFHDHGAISGGSGICYEIASGPTTTYVSECSGRGLCDRESGVCTCFKGYTNDNCDRQSTLAF